MLKYILMVFCGLVLLAGVLSLFESQEIKTVPLSEVVAKINSDEVEKITVKENLMEIALKNEELLESKKEDSVSAFETLLNLGAEPEKLSAVSIEIKDDSGLVKILSAILPVVLPMALILVLFWLMMGRAQGGAGQAFTFGKTKARLANLLGNKKVMFGDVAGLSEAKEEVTEIVDFLKDPKKYHRLGARIPRGILLVGSPGTGKTLLAKAVANEAGVPFYYTSGSEFVEMFVGVGANRVRDTFEMARKTSPAIIFVDEIDAIGRHRGAGLGGGHDEREQTLNQILVEMDGFDTDTAVIVMAATNRPDILDPALLRPGRFDRRIILDEPSLKDREEILKIHAVGKPLAEGINLRIIAERTSGFSGADLANLVNEAAILAARKNQEEILQDDFFNAIEKVILGPERRSHALSVKEKEITAYHEAGHALVAASLPHSDPVHKVSIVSRGRAGGYTLKVPSEDKHLRSKAEFETELAVLLGGYVAEKTVFKDTTTGASNDLRVASNLARKMVTQFGMSDKLGPITFGEKEEQVFLGKEISHSKNYSETIAHQIDEEVSKLIHNALETTRRIITEKMATLEKIAKELVARETLEKDDFYALIS